MDAPVNHNALHIVIQDDEESIDNTVDSIHRNDPQENNDDGQDQAGSRRGAPNNSNSSTVPKNITTTTTTATSGTTRQRNDQDDADDPLAGNSGRRGPRQPEVENVARLENPGLLVAPHHIVLRITEPDEHSHYEETKATITLHEVLSEYHGESREISAPAILQSVLEAVWADTPSIGRDADIVLIEVTRDVIRRKLVDDAATHCFPKQAPQYGIASKPADALAYYYAIWVERIPRLAAERHAWVADIEDRFCAWQLLPLAAYQDNEKIENLRLAIQFVKKWMTEPEPGVTERMIPGHLKLIQKGWNELKDAQMPSEQELRAAAAARQTAADTAEIVPSFRYPREYFQTLPTDKDDRIEYVRRIRHNYDQWKNTIVAQQFRKNVLLAFEKLMQHTTEWLGYTNTDKAMTESTLKMFFGLLQERWNEFLDKTEKYSPLLVKRPRNDDNDSDNGSAPSKKVKTTLSSNGKNDEDGDDASIETAIAVASQMFVEATKPAAKKCTQPTKFPVEELNRETSDDGEYSQVSLPFAKLIDDNPLRSDATKGLFGAVDQNDLDKVQHFFAQGATSNLCDEFGETPLHRAAAVGNKAILEHLRLWGADPKIQNSAGELPVHVAAWYGHANAVKFFLRQLKATSLSTLVDYRGRTPLHHACQQGHIAVVRELVDCFRHEHVIEILDHDRLSPRHYAIMGGQVETVQHLDGLGASSGDANTFDPTSLFDACSTGRLGLVQWIVESTYVDLTTAKDKQGRTARECALQGGHTKVVEWIDALLAPT